MIDVIIPAYKPDEKMIRLIEMLEKQTLSVNKIIVVNTKEKYPAASCIGDGFFDAHEKVVVYPISKDEFDHGKSRNLGASKSEADILVYMTQDAVPADEFLMEKLVKPLADTTVACSYARQLPDNKSTMVEILTREFNYPAVGIIKSKDDLANLGIKTYFCSNVCCAYNAGIFKKLEGFINHTIFNEDMIYAAKAIANGYKVAYAADAEVIHAHNYSAIQQFHRNFDLGVSQADHPEIFGGISSESEGIKMVKEIMHKLRKKGHGKEIPNYILTSGCKFIGYRMGKKYNRLPMWLVRKCTMNPMYWK